MIGADFNDHVGDGHRGDEEVMSRFGIQDRNTEGQTVDFANMDGKCCSEYFLPEEAGT